MKKIYITGVSGTGKTTIAHELEKRGFYAISIDEIPDLCSWVHQETREKHGGKDTPLTKEFVDQHDWIVDVEYLTELLGKASDTVFVLGMAGNQNEFLPMFDKILLLECSPETFFKRIDDRTDNDFGKDPEIKAQILNRYQPYAQEMLSRGAISISTDRPIEVVGGDVIAQSRS